MPIESGDMESTVTAAIFIAPSAMFAITISSVTTRGADSHVAKLLGKLGVANRREAAAQAAQRGLI